MSERPGAAILHDEIVVRIEDLYEEVRPPSSDDLSYLYERLTALRFIALDGIEEQP